MSRCRLRRCQVVCVTGLDFLRFRRVILFVSLMSFWHMAGVNPFKVDEDYLPSDPLSVVAVIALERLARTRSYFTDVKIKVTPLERPVRH